jgi:hypothetical protein
MHVATVTFEGFNELDFLIGAALGSAPNANPVLERSLP